ncbi:MAG: DUF547 domain-containing protein [Planctomycetota bacterium]
MLRHVFLVCLSLFAAACATSVPPPKIDLAGKDPQAAWARVLATSVDPEGRIDFTGMAKASADLDTYVAWVAQVDPVSRPELFPNKADQIAFGINSYNALAMYNVLHGGVLPVDTTTFFYFRELQLGGRWTSLYAYENDVIRPLGEERVHFALNCMVRACPRLPQQPFAAATLDQQLGAAAREFFGKPLHANVNDAAHTVRFSQILEFYTGDFLKQAPSLIAYANRHRSTPIPADYKVEFTPYDWTLNQR